VAILYFIAEVRIFMNWDLLKGDYESILQKLSTPSLDVKERRELQKKASEYSQILQKHEQEVELTSELEELKKLASEDSELKELYEDEISSKESDLKNVQNELEDLLYPADEKDNASVFLEIRAGAGGQEAALFVSDLFKMYNNYALSKHWNVSIVDSSSTDIGGFKELILYVKGKGVYKHLKFESGVHRVQRVPQTETAGRVHTSTVTVAVMPEAEEVEVSLDPNDLRIDVFRSSGPGGQSVNTTDSAVRITHVPTGIVVSCQDERSQIKNKAKAMKVLRARLLKAEKEKHDEELRTQRKQQVGRGERSEKIRTYNFPQNRVSDHRINLTLKKLDMVMEGVIDDIINPLIDWERSLRRSEGEKRILD
jgi:peptide chain release factor 1